MDGVERALTSDVEIFSVCTSVSLRCILGNYLGSSPLRKESEERRGCNKSVERLGVDDCEFGETKKAKRILEVNRK